MNLEKSILDIAITPLAERLLVNCLNGLDPFPLLILAAAPRKCRVGEVSQSLYYGGLLCSLELIRLP
jgi:hypothetical protein